MRFYIHAKALWALKDAGLIEHAYLKDAVKRIILQSSESPNWSHTTHYRSPGAGAKIDAAIREGVISSVSSYQAFCRASVNRLRHEHMVPTEVVYGLILGCPQPSLEAYEDILRRCGFRAMILAEEDARLHRARLPDLAAFTTEGGAGYFDHKCRYDKPKRGDPIALDARPDGGWAVSRQ